MFWRPFGPFDFLAIVNSAARNIELCVFIGEPVVNSVSYTPRSGIAGDLEFVKIGGLRAQYLALHSLRLSNLKNS